MTRSMAMVANLPLTSSTEDMNAIIRACLADGSGIFLGLLQKEIRRCGLDIPFLAHDLLAELKGDPVTCPL